MVDAIVERTLSQPVKFRPREEMPRTPRPGNFAAIWFAKLTPQLGVVVRDLAAKSAVANPIGA